MQLQTLLVGSLAALVAANDFMSGISDVTCGGKKWDEDNVRAAFIDGCTLYESNRTLGSNKYPHEFRNRESLTFSDEGPYMEYPITEPGYGTAKKGKKKSEFSSTQLPFYPIIGRVKTFQKGSVVSLLFSLPLFFSWVC